MNFKWNRLSTGVIIGLIAPLLTFFVFCLIAFPDSNCIHVLESYSKQNLLTHVISLSVIINLPLFFLFLNLNFEHSARGVIGATFVYAFIVIILKLVR